MVGVFIKVRYTGDVMKSLVVFAISTLFLLPIFVYAQEGLVPCGTNGNMCDICDVITLVDTVAEFIVMLSLVLATAGFVFAGFLYVTAAGNQSQLDKGKNVFKMVFMGIMFVLAAWLIVATISRALAGNESYVPWAVLENCQVEQLPGGSPPDPGGGITPGGGPDDPDPQPVGDWDAQKESEVREDLASAGIEINNPPCRGQRYQDYRRQHGSGCTDVSNLQPGTIQGLKELKRDCEDCFQVVTGGSENGHSTRGTHNHGNGYKVDLRLTGGLDEHIRNNPDFTYIGTRGDGAEQWRDGDGNLYALEGGGEPHWDITFF